MQQQVGKTLSGTVRPRSVYIRAAAATNSEETTRVYRRRRWLFAELEASSRPEAGGPAAKIAPSPPSVNWRNDFMSERAGGRRAWRASFAAGLLLAVLSPANGHLARAPCWRRPALAATRRRASRRRSRYEAPTVIGVMDNTGRCVIITALRATHLRAIEVRVCDGTSRLQNNGFQSSVACFTLSFRTIFIHQKPAAKRQWINYNVVISHVNYTELNCKLWHSTSNNYVTVFFAQLARKIIGGVIQYFARNLLFLKSISSLTGNNKICDNIATRGQERNMPSFIHRVMEAMKTHTKRKHKSKAKEIDW